MEKYKATLFKTDLEEDQSEPIDTILLDKICYTTAENFFFDKRGWEKKEYYHIEIEDMPRFLA